MTVTSLDQIVRNFIMKRSYTIHWWVEFMVYAKECLRELALDDLKIINTKLLTVGDQNQADLPSDYVDYVEVGVQVGQNVKPLVETDKINPLVNRDSSFNPINYNENTENITDPQPFYGALSPFSWNQVSWNEYGEFTGRMFGMGAGVQDDVFSVFPERNQIQLTENLSVDHILLRYISSGMSVDAASQITPYAYQTISTYIMWQMKENTRTYSEGEKERAKQEHISQRQILRARVSDLNEEVLTRLLQKANYGSPKSK